MRPLAPSCVESSASRPGWLTLDRCRKQAIANKQQTALRRMEAQAAAESHQRGLILLERHLEKNAGSTFREILLHSERQGKCMYWGFQQRSAAWVAAMAALRNLTPSDAPPRLCIEAHSGIDYGLPWVERFAQLRSLRTMFAERGIDIPMYFHVRLRSPLSHYISYFLWTVVERQARNARRFGSSFADWARTVPNLQSELLLSSKAAPEWQE